MFVGVFVFIIELVGDYYVCVRLLGVFLLLKYVINCGIGMEGIGCFLIGVFGSGNGIILYSENIGVIGIIKVNEYFRLDLDIMSDSYNWYFE